MWRFESIKSSVAPGCRPIHTVLAQYPRVVHPQMNRHRALSPSVSSSRAVPIDKMIAMVEAYPFVPDEWRYNQPGMVAGECLSPRDSAEATRIWLEACHDAVKAARAIQALGCHKEEVNRLLEPFAFVRTVITATEWDNFERLRTAPDADPVIQRVARGIMAAIRRATVQQLEAGDWHMPFVDTDTVLSHGGFGDPTGILRRASAACCARTSYRLPGDDRRPTDEDNHRTFSKLVGGHGIHATPFEHVAQPLVDPTWRTRDMERNFRDWKPWRVDIEAQVANGDFDDIRT